MQSAKARQIRSFKRMADTVLEKMGIAADCEISPQLGRNLSAIIRPTDGEPLFVKIIGGLEAEERFDRSVSFFNSADDVPVGVHTPRLLESDRANCAVVYQVIDDATKMSNVVTDDDVSLSTWESIGAELAALHSWVPQRLKDIDTAQPSLPPPADTAFSLDFYESASAGQLELFLILQSDEVLRQAITDLLSRPFTAMPIHGDLRTDQILKQDETLWIIDWEDFRLGDPARDLGSLIGEIFFHHMRPLLKRANGKDGVTPQTMQTVGIELIENAKPTISAIWNGYQHNCGLDDAELTALLDRVLGFVGWQMFDRSLSIGGFLGQISGFEKALVGMGRQMLIHRGGYATALGMGVTA